MLLPHTNWEKLRDVQHSLNWVGRKTFPRDTLSGSSDSNAKVDCPDALGMTMCEQQHM